MPNFRAVVDEPIPAKYIRTAWCLLLGQDDPTISKTIFFE